MAAFFAVSLEGWTMKLLRTSCNLFELGAVLCALFVPQPAVAFDQALSDEAVREAYFLGQDADRSADFLSNYVQALPMPDRGPDISQIELRTPYAQIVQISQQHPNGYSAQQAAADYRRRGDYLQVRVQVMFTPTDAGAEKIIGAAYPLVWCKKIIWPRRASAAVRFTPPTATATVRGSSAPTSWWCLPWRR
jgi:hypothetical protein